MGIIKILQTFKINYLLVILITIISTFFIINDSNKFVTASDKSISSVVTISSYSSNTNLSSNSNGIGSGVIFSEDGYIVTNLHIISRNKKVSVKLNNGNQYDAKIIGADRNSDIAILKIITTEILNPINFADSKNLKIGDKVLAIGNPYGIGISVSSGIVSATGRDYGNPYLELIQTDAAINPGNSGGALINENGNLIGINTKIFSKTGAYQGIGFAIPSDKVIQIASEIIKYGKVRNVWIGNFRVTRIRFEIDQNLLINGLQIVEMENEGPLFKKGVGIGDVIYGVNDVNVTWKNLTQFLSLAAPGDTIKLNIFTTKKEKRVIEIKTSALEEINLAI
ncbi:MAG: S1-C subfamily serine protease [Gammaproteobacteria bacterium]|jgi:S1-C subfamily serine protease|tara:strand:- start:9588 stop:10601 length:1014 start_codon:yes stop_codon:yes gene_type:complete